MLTGQEIGLIEALYISLTGLAVVMLELIILMFFIMIISLIFGRSSKAKKAAETKTAQQEPKAAPAQAPAVAPAPVAAPLPPPQAAPPVAGDVSEEEVAAIAASVCMASGMQPEEFRIVSITSI